MFNPNDKNFPPAKWNNYLAYYPGNGYSHMIGVTGYNTGSCLDGLSFACKTMFIAVTADTASAVSAHLAHGTVGVIE